MCLWGLHMLTSDEAGRAAREMYASISWFTSCTIALLQHHSAAEWTGFAVHMQTHQDWLAERGLGSLAKRVDASVI